MSSPIPSDIFQNNAKVLEKQREEMQWLLIQLEEVVKSCQAEHVAQKTRKEAERKRIVEEEEKKKKTLKYLQQLWTRC